MHGVKKASPWGEENCKQFVVQATDEGDKSPLIIGILVIGILLTEWFCISDVEILCKASQQIASRLPIGCDSHTLQRINSRPSQKLPLRAPAQNKTN